MISLEKAQETKSDNEIPINPPVSKCFLCKKEFKPHEHVMIISEVPADYYGEVCIEICCSWMGIDGKMYEKEIGFHKKCFVKIAGKAWIFE
jgi:hypothetical protein